MSIELFEYKGTKYPEWERHGFSARFIFPYAEEVCKGVGYDIGCFKKEWAFPGAIPIDPKIGTEVDKNKKVDYIFSSHCLEHNMGWVATLSFWASLLKDNGVMFLYLPDYSQEYWRPWNNRKHYHSFTKEIISDWLADNGFMNIMSAGPDLNHSFIVIGEKDG